jgi:4-amino-4-deoxy-L-arabinose transferase-like glycosyltransferase
LCESWAPGPLRLFNAALGNQVSWLLVLALVGLLASAWEIRLRALWRRVVSGQDIPRPYIGYMSDHGENTEMRILRRASASASLVGGMAGTAAYAAGARVRAPVGTDAAPLTGITIRKSVVRDARPTRNVITRRPNRMLARLAAFGHWFGGGATTDAQARLTPAQQAWTLWGMWLLTTAAFFSVAGFFHTYYLVMMAPPICALAGVGAVALWRDYQRPGWRGWLLLLALALTALTQVGFLEAAPASLG